MKGVSALTQPTLVSIPKVFPITAYSGTDDEYRNVDGFTSYFKLNDRKYYLNLHRYFIVLDLVIILAKQFYRWNGFTDTGLDPDRFSRNLLYYSR